MGMKDVKTQKPAVRPCEKAEAGVCVLRETKKYNAILMKDLNEGGLK